MFRVEYQPASLKAGEAGDVLVRVRGVGRYHLNEDYNTRVVVDPPSGLGLERDTWSRDKGDVRVEGEAGVVAIRVLGKTPGEALLRARAQFAVCEGPRDRPVNCTPVSQSIEVPVSVR